MDKIKLFWAYNTGPELISASSMFFNNLLSEIKKRVQVEFVWFVYQPEKKLVTKNIDDFKVIYLHDYNNALEVLSKEKPDVVFSTPNEDIPGHAFAIAAKKLNIPTVSMMYNDYGHKRSIMTLWKSYVTRFFEKSIATDTSEDTPQFMRRGRFFAKKYFFLLKTQRALGMNFFQILKSLLYYFISTFRRDWFLDCGFKICK